MYHCIRRLVKLFTRRVLLALIVVWGSLAREACSQNIPIPNTVSPPGAAALSTAVAPTPVAGRIALTNVMLNALSRTSVYVAPEVQHFVDRELIAKMLKKTHNSAKVIVLARLSQADGTTADLARVWQSELGPENTLLIVISDNPRQLAAAGGGLDDETLKTITEGAVRTFDSEGYPGGVAQIVRTADVELASRAARLRTQLACLIAAILIPLFWCLRTTRKKRRQELIASRRAATEWRDLLAPEMEKMEADCEYALIAESDEGRRQKLRLARTRTEEAYEHALTIFNNAEEAADFDRAQLALKNAQSQIQWTTVLLDQRRTSASAGIAEMKIEAPQLEVAMPEEPELKSLPVGAVVVEQAEDASAVPMDEAIDGSVK